MCHELVQISQARLRRPEIISSGQGWAMLAMNGGAPALEPGEKLRSSPGLSASNILLLATGFIFQIYLAPAQV